MFRTPFGWTGLAILIVMTGCGDTELPPNLISRTVLQIDPDAGADPFLDPAGIDSVWVEGDSLKIVVRYSGGCEDHDFGLRAPDRFESGEPALPPDPGAPPWLPVYLIHDGNGDACRALITTTLVFDIRPAWDLHRAVLGGDGLFAIRIHTLHGPGIVKTMSVLVHSGVTSSPRANVEAERITTFLTGELTAEDALYHRVRTDLEFIRSHYADSVTANSRPLGEIGFVLSWIPGEVLLSFDAEYADLVVAGIYPYWNRLNDAFDVIDGEILDFPTLFTVVLRFRPELHACALAVAYAELPGLIGSPRPNLRAGDWPGIFPRVTDDGVSYLFREAWGDCPAGCIHADLWYFESTPDGVFFRGRFNPLSGDPIPPWWGEADQNFLFYNNRCQTS